MILLYLVGLVYLVYYLLTRSYGYWESKGVPFDKPFLIFGSFYKLAARKEHIFHLLRNIYNQHKTPYVGIYIFHRPYLLARSPELLKKILVKDFDKFVNRPFAVNESVDPIAFHNLFSSKDATWRNLRSKISPVFTSGKMKLMLPLIKECVNNLTEYLSKHDGELLDVRKTTKKYSVDIISSCAFGISSNCLKNEDAEIMKMASKLVDFTSLMRGISVLSFFFIPKLVDIFRLTFLDKTASDYLVGIFKTALKERKDKNVVRNDLIDLLNNLKNNENLNDESYQFDDRKMASQAISFFQAGNDTISLTTTYAFYELALNKEVQERLRKEIREIVAKDGDITYENLQEMKYLDMVFNETLRKYPLTFLIRKSTGSYTFNETGLTLDKDTPVLIPVSALHYDPEYFPDPEKFDPERFSEENRSKIIPYTFLPFGEGPRNCIGQRFGMLVSKMAIISVINDFAWETSQSTEVPLVFNPASLLLQNKDGVILRIVKI